MWRPTALNLGPVGGGFYDSHTMCLGPTDIRVLRLHHGSASDEITCTLERRELPPSPKPSTKGPDLHCTALSYMWGDATKNLGKIQCNGTDFIVTRSLHSALFHLRDPHSDKFFWIDAICIDQSNNTEKARQVQRMGEIYGRATHTIIWLGDSGLVAREALKACSLFASKCRSAPSSSPAERLSSSRPWWDPLGLLPPFFLLLLLRRAYFTRIWIVQEVALSRNPEIACGPDRISWTDFSLAAATILEAGFGSKSSAGIGNVLIARSLLPRPVGDQGKLRGDSDPAKIFWTLTQHRVPQTKDILSLAILFRRSHATEPVDKLFGLFGLCERIQVGGTFGILPSYSRDDPLHRNRVYINTARRIIAAQEKLFLFSAINRRPPSLRGGTTTFLRGIWYGSRQTPALPTWVPDWNDSGSVATPLSLLLSQTHRTNVADNGQQGACNPNDTSE